MGLKDKMSKKPTKEVEPEEIETEEEEDEAPVAKKADKKPAKKAEVVEDESEDDEDGANLIDEIVAKYAERNEGEKITKALAKEVIECFKEVLPKVLFENDELRMAPLGKLYVDATPARTGESGFGGKDGEKKSWESEARFVVKFKMSKTGRETMAELEDEYDVHAADLFEEEKTAKPAKKK